MVLLPALIGIKAKGLGIGCWTGIQHGFWVRDEGGTAKLTNLAKLTKQKGNSRMETENELKIQKLFEEVFKLKTEVSSYYYMGDINYKICLNFKTVEEAKKFIDGAIK